MNLPLENAAPAPGGFRRVAVVGAAGAAALGASSLFGWLTGWLLLAGRTASARTPMAPSTALLFVLFGGALFGYIRWPGRRSVRVLAFAASLLSVACGVVAFIQFAAGPLEAGGRAMSPLTGASYLLAGLALALLVRDPWPGARDWAGGLAAVVTLANFVVVLGHLNGVELLRQFWGVPVAVTTAAAWLLLGAGLICTLGAGHFPLRPLCGPSARAVLLRTFMPVTTAVILVEGLVRGQALRYYLSRHVEPSPEDLANAVVLFSALSALLGMVVVCVAVSQVARVLGGRMDRAEAERQRILGELSQARDAAEAANRAKTLFLANTNHELRTPLNAVLGFCELLQEEAEEQGLETILPDLQKINAAGEHLLSVIRNVLYVAEAEINAIKLCPETFDLGTMLRNTAATIRPLVEKQGNQLVVEGADSLGAMYADVTRLRQCLFNLLGNAGKFTRKGTVTLSVARRPRDGRDWLLFRVRDTGPGMTPEQVGRLFQPFTQVHGSRWAAYDGSGVGLKITKELSQLMGGTVTVESEPGKGSTFTLEVPAEAARPQPEPAASASSWRPGDIREVPDGRPTLLVADDDPAIRELLERSLSREGFHVVSVARGEEVVAAAKELRPRAITLDVMMPGMDGWAVLTALKSDPAVADIPVVMVTIVEDRNLGYALGAADYLSKPLDRDRLVSILKKHCGPPTPGAALVVEGDQPTREMLRGSLELAGLEVAEAQSGGDALECVARRQPSLIVLDLMTPGMNGFEFITELRQRPEWQAIPLVVITARDLTPEDRLFLNGSLLLGGCVNRILYKGGFSRDDLLREVRDLVATRS
jgi:signal transduction histidine kinase/CheY-like chemotaxis protein